MWCCRSPYATEVPKVIFDGGRTSRTIGSNDHQRMCTGIVRREAVAEKQQILRDLRRPGGSGRR